MLITKMGREKKLVIASVASAAAIGITALVLDTDFNPATVANVVGAKCETQKEITVGYGYAKMHHTFIKSLFLGDKELVKFYRWTEEVGVYLNRCYEEEYKRIEI